MRVIDQVTAIEPDMSDKFLIDGDQGTRAIQYPNLIAALRDKVGYRSLIDDPTLHIGIRRNLYGNRNLGEYVTSEQWDAIRDGTFTGLLVGDYWLINGVKWRIMDMDYWYGNGDGTSQEVGVWDHHLVIMPDGELYISKFNDTDISTGGYIGSKMYKTGLIQAKEVIYDNFGASHIFTHRECLCNSVSAEGISVSSVWYNSTVELPNEPMMFGAYVHSPASSGAHKVNRSTSSFAQLSAMRLYKFMVSMRSKTFWIRDVATPTSFCVCSYNGAASYANASHEHGVRPVFGIKG